MSSMEKPELDFSSNGVLTASDLCQLDKIAAARTEEFNSMMAAMAGEEARNIDWWVSRPAGRNTHASNLFSYCAQLGLVRHYLDKGLVPCVRTDNAAMARILRPVLGPKNVALVGSRKYLRRWAHDIISTLYHAIMAKLAAWITRDAARAAPSGPLHLAEIYVLRDSFSGSTYQDRYFPGLYESLNEAQRATFYYLPIFHRIRDYNGVFRAMRRSTRNFLLREDYLRPSDYFFALGHWRRVRGLMGKKADFAGFGVGELVDGDILAGRFANSAFQALLTYRFWSRIGHGPLQVVRFLDWYEGHDFDHATAAALAWNGSAVEHIAFRPIASPAYLSLTPTRFEVSNGVVARRWGVVGTFACQDIQRACPALVVEPAPGLRHRWAPNFNRKVSSEGRTTILVLLSIELSQVRVLHKFLEAVMALSGGGAFTWLLKCHPAVPQKEIEEIFLKQLEFVSFIGGAFSDALANTDVVVGLGTNTLIEAIAVGVPAICVSCGNQPAEIPLSFSTKAGWWRMAYEPADFCRLLPEALAASREGRGPSAALTELLGPFDPEILRATLFGNS